MRQKTAHNTNKGFTLIEVLVVVGIIAILATTITGSLSIARERGAAAKIVGDVKIIKGALQFRYAEETTYPTEEDLESLFPDLVGATKTITNLIDADVFEGKFPSAPEPSIGTGGSYVYDSDASDIGTNYPIEDCGSYTNNGHGVNIILPGAIETNPNIVEQLDQLIDSGDGLDCGVIRRFSAFDNSLLYNISITTTQFP